MKEGNQRITYKCLGQHLFPDDQRDLELLEAREAAWGKKVEECLGFYLVLEGKKTEGKDGEACCP